MLVYRAHSSYFTLRRRGGGVNSLQFRGFCSPTSEVTEVRETIRKTKEAQQQYSHYEQHAVDRIVYNMACVLGTNRLRLAKSAVEDTGRGVLEDKVIKNHFASEYVYNKYKDMKTCGVIEEDKQWGITKIAEPIGVIAAVTPVTNPTSTVIFKAMMAMKTRNGIIFAPHPSATKCTIEAASLALQAAVEAGAPPNIISWIEHPSIPATQELMASPDIDLDWVTGGGGVVKIAQKSGRPSILSGAGNAPALIDETADYKMAVSSILMSKDFDHGMICATEQSVVVVDEIYDEVLNEFRERGAYILNEEQVDAIRKIFFENGFVNKNFIGKSAQHIASLIGLDVPKDTRCLIGQVKKIGEEEPWSHEKLSPLLSMYRASEYKHGIEQVKKLVEYGGVGHTAIYYTNERNNQRIFEFETVVPVSTILANIPASHGAIGDIYNFKLEPTLSIPAGTSGAARRITPLSFLRIKSVSYKRDHILWFKLPPKIYYNDNCTPQALSELSSKRCMIITDESLIKLGYVKKIVDIMESFGTVVDVFGGVEPDPSFNTVIRGVNKMNYFEPDTIIAFGGGSPMDAAKLMQLIYENPQVDFDHLKMRFMDIMKRTYNLPDHHKTRLVCIGTTSGTGSEVSPFAVISDPHSSRKYPLADYSFTPYMAIVDPQFTVTLPQQTLAWTAYDALTHAVESMVSVIASSYTKPLSIQATASLGKNMLAAYRGDGEARKEVHISSSLAGFSLANAFVGLGHSIAHQIGSEYHLAHGVCCAIILPYIVEYNSSEHPFKQATFPQYKFPIARERYCVLADSLGINGKNQEEKLENFITFLETLRTDVGIPASWKEAGIPEQDFLSKIDALAEQAFDDQCTVSNPRYPLISEIKTLLTESYYGNRRPVKL